MKWYLAKMVYRIVCGDGEHMAQFDEQLRLVAAANEEEAFDKATAMGNKEQDSFLNQRNEWVRWQFVNISELYLLSQLIDGAEIYSRITEVDDAEAYLTFVQRRAESLREKQMQQLSNLI